MKPVDVSVVIPALNEEATLARSIGSAWLAGAGEVIVVDGGSRDATMRVATESGASKIVRSLPGRGTQLNSGALLAEREVLLFLHADNLLDAACLEQICEHPDLVWGSFRQQIDSPKSVFRFIEIGNALRAKYRRMPFGDQAIFVRREMFQRQGGFAEIPLMEDYEFSRRLRKLARPLLLDGPVSISARRWEENGPIQQTLRNWSIQLCYRLGAKPETLRKRYR